MLFKQFHFWQIISYSPWPFYLSFFLSSIPLYLVNYIQGIKTEKDELFMLNLISLMLIMLFLTSCIALLWFKDVIVESTILGYHTKYVKKNLRISFILFIFSEVMLFVAFFWAYFHCSLFPSIEFGLQWPPRLLESVIISWFDVPFINTLLLITSGFSLTLSHILLRKNKILDALKLLSLTIVFAILFLFFQFIEYLYASFNITDGIYGSTFFMCTGLHGFHVFAGFMALTITFYRMESGHFSRSFHLGFEFAAWYWHFVDIVWLFLYFMIYYWGFIGVTSNNNDDTFSSIIF